MTDREKLKKLFDEFGIGYKEDEDGEIVCEEGGQRIGGYNFFYTVFSFDATGGFVEMGAYE